MSTKLSLISYIISKYDINSNLTKDVINFIKNHENVLYLIRGMEVDGENQDMVNYILSYLNDDITDNDTYSLCLDTAIFISNYSKILDNINQNYTLKPKINIKMLTKM